MTNEKTPLFSDAQHSPSRDKRGHPRFAVAGEMQINLAIEDPNSGESLGIAEASDISLEGVRVRNLSAGPDVRIGDHLEMLLIGRDRTLSLEGEVVHHGSNDGFGVKFVKISPIEQRRIMYFLNGLRA